MKRSTYIKNKYKRSEQLLIGDRVYISNAPIEQRHRNGLKGTIISFQDMPPIFKNKVAIFLPLALLALSIVFFITK